jgi:Trk K+ transport system NAD-binding subunit
VRIVIVGAGEVGYHIASRLSREHHDIVVVDQSRDLSSRLQEELDVLTYCGHGANPGILEQAGIAQAEMLIAVTSSDEVNLVACLLPRQYGVPRRLARLNELVAYLGAADILLRPLPCRLSDTYQPVISPQNRFSTPHPRLLA